MFDNLSYYYIIMAFQGFCLFHAYKNGTGQKWYWLIIFLPFIGCLIYLYENFYTPRSMGDITEGVKGLVYSNYAVEKLEKEVKYSETITNKMNLADAYTERGRCDEAIKLYESCRKGYYETNPDLLRKMVQAYYLKRDYTKVVELGQQLTSAKGLGDSEDKIAYSWALHYTGDTPKAEAEFKKLDAKFANFQARIEFAKFYIETSRPNDAKRILTAIIDEHEGMDSYERGLKKGFMRESKRLLQTIK
jgi:hypothetical protein